MEHVIVMQMKEKEINYKRQREENEFAQKVHPHTSYPYLVLRCCSSASASTFFFFCCSN